MTRVVVGDDRRQSTLFAERLDDYLGEDGRSPLKRLCRSTGSQDTASAPERNSCSSSMIWRHHCLESRC